MGAVRKYVRVAPLYAALAIMTLLGTCASAAFAQEPSGQASLTLERHVQSQGLFPVQGDYVLYDITVKNTGTQTIEGRSLWVSFVPVQAAGEAGSSARFEVPALAPGTSALLHAGPFKLHGAGRHALYVGINKAGDAKSPDDVALNTAPGAPVDSVDALDPAIATAIPAGAGMAAGGVALLAWLFFARKRRI